MGNHLRAILVLLHLLAICTLALPAPVGGINERSYKDPSLQATFGDYAKALQAVGLDISRKELQDRAWVVGKAMVDFHNAAKKPFMPYYQATGTWQGWRMFGYVSRKPARLEVYARMAENEDWQPIFIARSSEWDWRATQLDQERMRGLVNDHSWRRGKGRYLELSRWLARQAAADLPQAHALKVQMRSLPLPSPEQLREQGAVLPGDAFWEVEFDLAELR